MSALLLPLNNSDGRSWIWKRNLGDSQYFACHLEREQHLLQYDLHQHEAWKANPLGELSAKPPKNLINRAFANSYFAKFTIKFPTASHSNKAGLVRDSDDPFLVILYITTSSKYAVKPTTGYKVNSS